MRPGPTQFCQLAPVKFTNSEHVTFLSVLLFNRPVPSVADPGGGGEAQGDFPGAGLPFHAQRHGGPVPSPRTHGHHQELPPRLWQ